MQQPSFRRATRLLGAGVLALGLAVVACSDQPANPVLPSSPAPAAASQTLTITAQGVFPSLAYVDANFPVRIVNADTQAHQLHLDVSDQPGCSAFEAVGEIPPGESRLTGMITSDASGCDVHDHMNHGDKRFSVQIVVGDQ